MSWMKRKRIMSTITVYKDKDEVFYNTLYQEFQVLEDSTGKLFWDETKKINSPGVIKVWLQVVGSTLRLPFVLPDWQLIIDGVWMAKRFYQDVEESVKLKGKVVELRFEEYRFIFQID
jgi:hypothetical protein